MNSSEAIQAEQFLQNAGLEFRAVLIGSDCPPFCPEAEKQADMDLVDTYPRKTHIHGKHYRCTFSRKGRGHVTVEFWNSYMDEERNWAMAHPWDAKNIRQSKGFAGSQSVWESHASTNRAEGRKRSVPQPYDVLACMTKSDPGTFEQFCGDLGYDTDSRKAESIYHAVQQEWRKVQRFFTSTEIEQLQDIS